MAGSYRIFFGFHSILIVLRFCFHTAAEWMNWGMEKGAEKLGGLMAVGGEKLRNNLKPANTEQPVDDKYQRGLEIARNTTNKVVIVSSYVGMY